MGAESQSLRLSDERLVFTPQRRGPPDLPKGPAYTLKPGQPIPGRPNFLRPPLALRSGTGLLTCFPSTTPLGLALGADSPCADERCAGNLGLSAEAFFTPLIVTHVSIRTSDTSSMPSSTPSPAYGTLPYRPPALPPFSRGKRRGSRSFGIPLKPRYIFRAGRLDQ